MIKYYILGSGSTGNCTILENDEHELLLIDCGIAINKIKERMESLNLDFANIKYVMLTHLHTDHSLSARVFDRSQIIAHKKTRLDLPEENLVDDYDVINLLGFEIVIIPMSHDDIGTMGFIIQYKDCKMAFITDTGYVHINIQRMINNCDIYLIESNHDPRMLMMTKRPIFLKHRILSIRGHLSNQDCSLILANVIGPRTKEITFIHRSLQANSEELIMQTFQSVMEDRNIEYKHLKINIADARIPLQGGDSYEKQI